MPNLRKVLFLLFSFLASHSIFSGLFYRHSQRRPDLPARLPLIAPALSEKTGQQAAPPPGGPNVPEIQTFTALGSDDMVDLFSGDFKYNIPLLDVGGYPVILNYNSNPSITEDASMVGFGWNLNVGSINRNVRGLPDDFSGDAVTEVQSDQADYTITGNLGAQFELFGKKLRLTPGASLSYNYYTGFFTSESFSAGYKLMKFGDVKLPWGKFSAGIDLQSGFSEGLSVSPSLKFSLENYGSIKGKLKMSPEKIVKEFGFYTETDYYRFAGMGENGYDDKKNLILEERGSNYKASGGTTFRLKSQDFSPSVVFPRTSYSLNLDASAGVELFGLDAGISTGVSFTRSYIKDNTLTKAGYGYLNAHKAGESDLMDFVRSDEGIVQREKPQLFPVFSTYDVFSISAEGLQTEIRPFRTDIPLLHDAKTESKSGSGGMGLEVSGGNLFKGGGNINGTYSSGENGPWVKHDSGIPSCRPDAAEDACWYFGQTGLQTPETDEQLKENILQGDKPVRFSIQAQTFFNRLEGEIPARTSNFESSLRPKNAPNIAVQALSAKQANRFGLERDIVSYPLNPLSGNASAEKEVLPRYRESELKSAKEHHISEFIVTNSNGNRYHFGIPVYNRSQEEYSFNVSGDFDRIPGSRFIKYRNTGAVGTSNNNGLNSKFKQLSTPAYASGFLLTAILSTDYSDLTGDGPSEDDLGNYTHFKYTRVSDRYRWRIPYGEQTASLSENSSLYTTKDNGDDMAGFTTGEKELWYINAIETRNYIARFYYSPRNDGAGSGNSIHGRSARAAGRDANRLAAEGQALMKLDKIVLFSKTRTPDGSRELPVKTVHFEYDYSLCTNSPDNISNNARDNGKLTLRKVYFVHRESQKSRFSPYIFYYNSSKPYSDLHTDRWNMYKDPEPGFSNEEFPYSFQGEDNYASLWRLNRILLPTGGLIKVDYERDEYALVEDKKAMTMLRIAGFGSRDGAMRQGVQDLNDDLTKIFLHRPAFISREMAETDAQNGGKILGKMFGKLPFLFYEIPIRMGHDDPEKFESINGFLELGENLQFGTDYAYTGSNKEFISIVFNGSLIGSWHPLQMDAFRNAADCHPGLMASFGEPGQELDAGRVLAGIGASGLIGSMVIPTLKNRLYTIKGVGKKLNTEKAFCRVYHPLGRKKGAQSRVKAIRIYDNWTSMVKKKRDTESDAGSDIPGHFYGQAYDYTLETDDGIISSGVASYEPSIGQEEIPHNQPDWTSREDYYSLKKQQKNKHFAAALYPAAGVGYSKVTVRSIHSGYARSGTGRSEHEFYTAADFPVKLEKTNCSYKGTSPAEEIITGAINVIAGFGGFGVTFDHFTASQGFSIILNDMHGKPRSVKVYEENGIVPVAGNQYFYKTKTEDQTRLHDRQTFLMPDGSVTEKKVNTDVDFSVYTRRSKDLVSSGSLALNLDVFTTPPSPIPVFSFTPSPGLVVNREETYLVMATKVICTSGILDRVESYNYGQVNQTSYYLSDAQTGTSLVSSTRDRYNQPVYSSLIPAFWLHPGMGKTSLRAGRTVKNVKFDILGQTLDNVPDSYVLKPGDLVAVTAGNTPGGPAAGHTGLSFQYHVKELVPQSSGGANKVFLMDANGYLEGCFDAAYRSMLPLVTANVYLLRPAEHNQLDQTAGKVESGEIPFTPGGRGLSFQKVISASASQYSDRWQTHLVPRVAVPPPVCNCTEQNNAVSALEAKLRNLRTSLQGRQSDNNYLHAFLDEGNCTIELWGEALQVLFSPNSQVSFVSLVPDQPDFPCQEVNTFTVTYDVRILIPPAGKDSKTPPATETRRLKLTGRSCTIFRRCQTATTTTATRCATPVGENINPYRAGVAGFFREEKNLFYAGERNYPANFSNADLRSAGYFTSFTPYWSCGQLSRPAANAGSGLWVAQNRITKRDLLGKVLEVKDTLERFHSSLYTFKNQFPNASANNARYSQIAFESFEDLIYNGNRFNPNECDDRGFHFLPSGLLQPGGFFSLSEEAHTGIYALKVRRSGISPPAFSVTINRENLPAPSPTSSCGAIGIPLKREQLIGKFQPSSGTYLVSCWVKVPGSSDLEDDLSGISLSLGGMASTPHRGPIINCWQNIWDTIRILQADTRFSMEIRGNGEAFLIDDLRIHPYLAGMKSYVYDPVTYKTAAELDENNFATFYEYDKEGNLERIKKETEKGILTLKEIRFGNIKTLYEAGVPESENPKINVSR